MFTADAIIIILTKLTSIAQRKHISSKFVLIKELMKLMELAKRIKGLLLFADRQTDKRSFYPLRIRAG